MGKICQESGPKHVIGRRSSFTADPFTRFSREIERACAKHVLKAQPICRETGKLDTIQFGSGPWNGSEMSAYSINLFKLWMSSRNQISMQKCAFNQICIQNGRCNIWSASIKTLLQWSRHASSCWFPLGQDNCRNVVARPTFELNPLGPIGHHFCCRLTHQFGSD